MNKNVRNVALAIGGLGLMWAVRKYADKKFATQTGSGSSQAQASFDQYNTPPADSTVIKLPADLLNDFKPSPMTPVLTVPTTSTSPVLVPKPSTPVLNTVLPLPKPTPVVPSSGGPVLVAYKPNVTANTTAQWLGPKTATVTSYKEVIPTKHKINAYVDGFAGLMR